MGNAQPNRHLDELLQRAHNGFELSEELLTRLRSAGLMWHTQLHSFRQRKGPPRRLARRTLKHVCLLADGGNVVLWEVEHNTGADGQPSYEIYTDAEAMAEAQRLIDHRFGDPAPEELDAEATEFLSRLPELRAAEPVLNPRSFVWDRDGTADHASRLLRRAVNVDAPGQRTRLPLMGAVAYDIMYVTGRHSRIGDCDADGDSERVAGWTLYEHAFLMADGSEASLWEVEHTMAPDGLPVCEVYADRGAACDAADGRLVRLETR
jgi:Family of unknown function (DUF6227)